MNWMLSWRADPLSRRVADRHYSRQSVGAKQFVPPGSCLVLRTTPTDALWITSWPMPEYVKHEWPGAWICSAFRNEGLRRSSMLIREAVAATLWHYGRVPESGMITFVDPDQIRSTNPGYCFLQAGFKRLKTRTKTEGLRVLQLLPEDMPEAAAPILPQTELLEVV